MNRIDEPKNERSRRTRARVLDATWRLLEERGSHGVTMAAVADQAGVTRRALYLHFSSRADLLMALHTHVDETLDLASSVRRVFDAPDGVAALDAFATHLAEFHPRIQAVDDALLRARDTDPDVAALVEHGSRVWMEGCRHITQRLADEGRLAEPWTVDTAADVLWHFMFPDVVRRLRGERTWTLDQHRDLLGVLLRRTLVAD